jgi:DtxR family Mn-dependent transcriptional regulator
MGLPWHEIHDEAVRLEHALSPNMEARIEALVGDSTTCPHGNPIPGNMTGSVGTLRMDNAEVGRRFRLLRIVEEAEENTELISYLQSNGLIPGEVFDVVDHSTSFGITLQRGDHLITISPQITAMLWGEIEP